MLLRAVRDFRPFLSLVLLVLTVSAGVGFGQTTYYVNGVTGKDDCHTGLAPVPTDLCPFPPEPASVAGPFRTITRAALAAQNPASGLPVTILVAGVSSGGNPVVYNAALGESFPILVPRETMIRYDAANSAPGVLVTVDGGGIYAVFVFVAGTSVPFSSAGGIDGSTLGAGTHAITVQGGTTGVEVTSDGFGALNSITLKNVRFSNNLQFGVHVLAGNGSLPPALARCNPTLDTCFFTQDTSPGVTLLAHLFVETDDYGWCQPIVFNCLFRVEPDAFGVVPRVENGIRMVTSGINGDRLEGTFIANIIDGLSNVCTTCAGCTPRGIDYGLYVLASTLDGASAPTFTTSWFQNCGVTGSFVHVGGGNFSPTFSNCNFLYNGKRWSCNTATGDFLLDSQRGHGAGVGVRGGESAVDFQYCLAGGNRKVGFHAMVMGLPGTTPTQRIRLLSSQASYNSEEGIWVRASNGVQSSWLGGGPNIVKTKVDHNGAITFAAGLRLSQGFLSSTFGGNFSPNFLVTNLLAFRNIGPGILISKQPNVFGFEIPVKLNFVTAAWNGEEGIRGENMTGAQLPEIENMTARLNRNGNAIPSSPSGAYDVWNMSPAQVRWSNVAGNPLDGFPPDTCTWPDGFGTSQNLHCDPDFVNAALDDFHLIANENTSRSLDTGIDSPVGGAPTFDFDGNPRITDYGGIGSNGNFLGNVADRGCYEIP